MMVCHLCGGELFKKPTVSLKRMPTGAQVFNTTKSITLRVYQCSMCGLIQHTEKPVPYWRKEITMATPFRKQATDSFIRDEGLTGQDAMPNILTPNKKYDYFVSWNWLEHLPNLGKVIRNIHSHLKPNGSGMVVVPNFNYILNSCQIHDCVVDHISYFTELTIALAFRCNGFFISKLERINNDTDILIQVQKREPLDTSSEQQALEAVIDKVQSAIDSYTKRGKKVAVWSAGHRALALLATGKIKGIEYVVDSTPHKQGKRTPVTNYPIVSPNVMRTTNEVDMILCLLPAPYQPIVIQQIKAMNLGVDIMEISPVETNGIHIRKVE